MEAIDTSEVRRRFRLSANQKIFSFDHATKTLPLVSQIVTDIVAQYKRVCRIEDKCQAPSPDKPADEVQAMRDEYADELDRLEDLRDELSTIGCQLKDWRRGVVDFTVLHKGRPVELCWRLGDEKFVHWHEFDCGFRQREEINDEFIAALGPAKGQA